MVRSNVRCFISSVNVILATERLILQIVLELVPVTAF